MQILCSYRLFQEAKAMHSSGSLADTPDCFLVRTADQEKKDSNMIQHDAILPALIPCHLKENKTKISILPTKKWCNLYEGFTIP